MLFRSCTPVFTTALCIIVKVRKKPKCPSTDDEWIKKLWYVYTMKYYSAIKKNKILPFAATQMDLESIMLSEISQRKTDTVCYHLCVESKK